MSSPENPKPSRPRRRRTAALPGVQVSQPRSDGSFRYRARIVVRWRQITGPWRATPGAASKDVERLRRAEVAVYSGPLDELGPALERVAIDAKARGLQPITIERQLQAHAKFLLSYWEADAPLLALTVDEIEGFVRAALEHGRAPATLKTKDLPLLDAAFRLAGFESPIPEVRKRMRAVLKARTLEPRAPSFEEIGEVLRRIRTERFTHKLRGHEQETELEGRERHAALIELLACTGIRAGELERLELEDVDLERGSIAVRKAKDRANPRVLPIPSSIVPSLRRLLASVPPGQRPFPDMSTLGARLARWRKRLGAPWLNARALRHAYATKLADSGASLAAVMKGMGHREPRTAARYIDASQGRLEAHAEVLGEALAAAAAPPPPEEPAPGSPLILDHEPEETTDERSELAR